MKNHIGIPQESANLLIDKLNELLANTQIFSMNARGMHWNIKGEKFFELHLKFEELYNDLNLKVDEIAERILTLGGTPLHTYSDYYKLSKIQESSHLNSSQVCLANILESFEILLIHEREILQIASDANDEGSNALMSDYIRQQEKMVWMYRAYNS
jgi:starvation-inducible DNA-binding protein